MGICLCKAEAQPVGPSDMVRTPGCAADRGPRRFGSFKQYLPGRESVSNSCWRPLNLFSSVLGGSFQGSLCVRASGRAIGISLRLCSLPQSHTAFSWFVKVHSAGSG